MKNNFSAEDLEKIFKFFHQAEKLKTTMRFLESKDIVQESSAAHSWRLSLMTFVIASELKLSLNTEKALKIAIVHDLAESITGDIDYLLITNGKVPKEEKKKLEENAMQQIKNSLPKKIGNEIYNLWKEFETQSTNEGKFVKALDKLETLTHLVEVGYKAYDKTEVIPTYADEAVKTFPELSGVLKKIKKELKLEFEKGSIPWREEYNYF